MGEVLEWWSHHITPAGWLFVAYTIFLFCYMNWYGRKLWADAKRDPRQEGRYDVITRRSRRLLFERLSRHEPGAILYIVSWLVWAVMVVAMAWLEPMMIDNSPTWTTPQQIM